MRGRCLPLGLIDFQKAEIREDTVAPTKEGSTKGVLSFGMPKQQLTGKTLSPHPPNMPQPSESGKSNGAFNCAQSKCMAEGGVRTMLLMRLAGLRGATAAFHGIPSPRRYGFPAGMQRPHSPSGTPP
uniref:Uncharacterized protein n=1 Tax=Chromera velia CCMP2878 TaxID=1169474 RepID=A0A0G4HHP5_9ALVE|eukprot:Cvel_6901.t1-p1 / transcript=Cvel_6901.t1 / gene=Cvel_6901 / organism=Chromera_velia_CCMP2878 / gene_product=hypothetical protein / transcript_product=hypothetical protein / location=Cvel_scaffold349:29330-37094(+) / protein_length=126 / sequence_SO=supercontig / SO=protein_coding / is_pseudo=false